MTAVIGDNFVDILDDTGSTGRFKEPYFVFIVRENFLLRGDNWHQMKKPHKFIILVIENREEKTEALLFKRP